MTLTFALVCLAWVFFRAATINDAVLILAKVGSGLIRPDFYVGLCQSFSESRAILLLLPALVLLEWMRRRRWNVLAGLDSIALGWRWATYTTLFWAVLLFGTQRTAEFIYFRF
jgi:hypothetical protein